MPWGLAAAVAGPIIGGLTSSSSASKGAQQSLTGYNYLAGNGTNQAAQTAGVNATGAGAQTQSQEAQLLGTAPMTQQAQTGFNNYLNSTGYQFQQQQGDQALTGSAAARGILGSGSTAKALTQYGQGLAGQSFNNYLNNLSGLNTQQQNTANTGVNAAEQVGQAGTTGGSNAGTLTSQGGVALGNGITTAAGAVGSGVANGNFNNFFGSI